MKEGFNFPISVRVYSHNSLPDIPKHLPLVRPSVSSRLRHTLKLSNTPASSITGTEPWTAAESLFKFSSSANGFEATRFSEVTIPDIVVPASPYPETSLGGLPAELQLAILQSVSDVPTLKALVCTSTAFHQLYLRYRKFVLPCVLSNMPGEIILGALILFQARGFRTRTFRDRNSNHNRLLKQFHEKDHLKARLEMLNLNLEKMVEVARVQFKLYRSSRRFINRHEFGPPAWYERSERSGSVRLDNMTYIHSAMYRLEIFRVMFKHEEYHNLPLCFIDGNVMSFAFMIDLKFWEVEDIACIRLFLAEYYHDLLFECLPGLGKKQFGQKKSHFYMTKSEEKSETRDSTILKLDRQIAWFAENVERCIALGFDFLHTISTADTLDAKLKLLDQRLSYAGVRAIGDHDYFLTSALASYDRYDYWDAWLKDVEPERAGLALNW